MKTKEIIEFAKQLSFEDGLEKIADANYETANAIESLNNGDITGDKIADSLYYRNEIERQKVKLLEERNQIEREKLEVIKQFLTK
jgi:hypothetical protein